MAKKTPTANPSVIAKNLLVLKVSYILFILLTTVKCLVWPPLDKQASVVIWIIQVTPLLVFAPAIFKHNRRQIAGFCYVLLIYFVAIGANMFVPQTRMYTWSGLVLLITLYTSGMMHVRWTRAGVVLQEN